MERIITFLLSILFVVSMVGCAESSHNMQTDPSAPTSTASTHAVSTTTTAAPAIPTIQPTPPPATVPPTTIPPSTAPTIGPTCAPVVNDAYWGEFRGKVFANPELGTATSYNIQLFSDGTCTYYLSIYNSSQLGARWKVEEDILYLYNDNECTTFRYIPGETSDTSKLIYIKGDNDLYWFQREEDGLEFVFAGIIRW